MRILVLNPGSSTLKVSLVDSHADGSAPTRAADRILEWPADAEGRADDVVRRALSVIGAAPEAVGYRVVHGGPDYRAASRVDAALIETVLEHDPLAPLHNRRAAAVMRAGLAEVPETPHVACFDTAFHATLPEEGWRYPLPAEWVERWGIRRYGFHGLSVAWSTRRAGELLGRPAEGLSLVVAHLGSGCSVTAVAGGRSVDTSMGFTPYEGLIMGTRAGSIDPGILLHLAANGIEAADLAEGLARRSGLLAVGGSPDVRELQREAAAGSQPARLALALFARRAAGAIAAATTTLDRLDALVFTGGIGEHAADVRADVVRRLGVLGVPEALDEATPDAVLAGGPPAVLAVAAREDLVIARAAADLLAG